MNLKFLAPLILSSGLIAQTGVPQKPPIQQSPPPVQFVQGPPALTELEQTKLELYTTQNMMLRRQEDELKQKYIKLVNDINVNHPGYVFSEQTGQLVPTPKTSDSNKEPYNPPVGPKVSEQKKPEVKK